MEDSKHCHSLVREEIFSNFNQIMNIIYSSNMKIQIQIKDSIEKDTIIKGTNLMEIKIKFNQINVKFSKILITIFIDIKIISTTRIIKIFRMVNFIQINPNSLIFKTSEDKIKIIEIIIIIEEIIKIISTINESLFLFINEYLSCINLNNLILF